MRKLFFLHFFLLFQFFVNAATFRNLISQSLSGNILTLWVNSDTVFGENTDAELKYDSGGSTLYFWTNGVYDTSTPGANWKITITIPVGATNVSFQLANKNESGVRYGHTGFVFSPLSVEKLNLQILPTNNTNKVQWSTALETNNDYFEVLYSTTGKDFQIIGTVKGAGSTSEIQNYSFVHQNPARGRSFYRLRQVDFDGKYEYSPIRSVVTDRKIKEIQIAPNPVSDFITLIHDGSRSELDISIRDITGRSVAEYKNFNGESLDVSQLPAGIYTITLIAEGVATTQKMVRE